MSGSGSERVVLAACGCCTDGRLGLGEAVANAQSGCVDVLTLLPWCLGQDGENVATTPNVTALACGGYHNLVLTEDGGVYGWGSNDQGQLGLPCSSIASPQRLRFFDECRTASKPRPQQQQQEEEETVVGVACGGAHSLVRTTRGLYVAGGNTFGQLGLGDDCQDESVRQWRLLCSLPLHPSRCAETGYQSLPVCASRANAPSARGCAVVSETLVQGEVAHMSCGTHHTLLAWRNAVVCVVTQPAAESGLDSSESIVSYVHYPVLITACGKGDFGELGYDGDAWAVMRSKNQRVQSAAVTAAQHPHPQNDHAHANGESASTKPFYGFAQRWKPQTQRRPEFFSNVHCAVQGLPPSEAASTVVSDLSEVAAAHGTDALAVVQLNAAHLHSSVTFRLGGDGETAQPVMQAWHWGCYYNSKIEDINASVPRLVDEMEEKEGAQRQQQQQQKPWHVHAGNEVLLRYAPSQVDHTRAVSWEVLGSGNLGLGDDDSFQPDWTALTTPPLRPPQRMCGTQRFTTVAESDPVSQSAEASRWGIARVVGRDHFVGLLRGESGDALYGFGSNLYGELGLATATHDDESGDAQLTPACLLRRGDCLAGPPSSGPTAAAAVPQDVYRVTRILDVGAGARHTMALLVVEPVPSS